MYSFLTIFKQFPAWLGLPGPGDITILLYFFLTISAESEIESALGVSLSTLIDRRDARLEEIDNEE